MSGARNKEWEEIRRYDFLDRFGTMIRHQLENLLRIIHFESEGKVVFVDFMTLAHEKFPSPSLTAVAAGDIAARRTTPVFRKLNVLSFREVEPRLVMISHFLAAAYRCVEFHHQGRPVSVDGYRLANLAFWARYPCLSVYENLNFESISDRCSCDCEFCFLKGLGLFPLERRMMTLEEARTRAKYYSPESRRGLPVPAARPAEPFLNRRIIEFLKIVREKQPRLALSLTTNGDFLTERMVDRLVEFKPILIIISLNSANRMNRSRVMRSAFPDVAIEAVPLLRSRGIQFIGSIVAAPSLPLSDIDETVRFLDRNSALFVRVILPGFTRFHPREFHFETEPWWNDVAALGRSLRTELTTPILLQPNLYWDRDIAARIDGVYRNSPAERAGLKASDRITHINDRAIFTKADVWDVFEGGGEQPTPRRFRLTYERVGRSVTVELDGDLSEGDDFYPFKPRGYRVGEGYPGTNLLGMHLPQGIRLKEVASIKTLVEKHPQARKVLLFTTPLVKEHFLQAIAITENLPECRLEGIELRLTTAPQNYWRGNIVVGDLNVVQDYLDQMDTLRRYEYRPDLVLIPRSFVGVWGFDLNGRSYLDIERRTGIPVELIPNVRIMI